VAKEKKYVRVYSRKQMETADARQHELGYRIIPDGAGPCAAGGCYKPAKEEWVVPDHGISGRDSWLSAKHSGEAGPVKLLSVCGHHSPRNAAGLQQGRHAKDERKRKEYEIERRNRQHAESTYESLKRWAPIAPVGFRTIWDGLLHAYVYRHRDPAMQYSAAERLKRALAAHIASLSEAEQTLLALEISTPLPTKEN